MVIKLTDYLFAGSGVLFHFQYRTHTTQNYHGQIQVGIGHYQSFIQDIRQQSNLHFQYSPLAILPFCPI